MSLARFRSGLRARGRGFVLGAVSGVVVAVALTALTGIRPGSVFFSGHPVAWAAEGASGGGFSVAHVAERALPSVVNIASSRTVRVEQHPFFRDPMFRQFFRQFGQEMPHEQKQQGLGSGVIVSADGLVVTNNHVVANMDDILVGLHDGRKFKATVVGTDPKSDLAVLRLKGARGLTPATMGDSDSLKLGDGVLAIGNPFGVGQTVTMGIVSAKGRANMGIVDYEDFIQTDAAINPGNSGGALVSMRGELVGINTAILSRSGGYQGIGFAIPTNMMKPIMESLVSKGKVIRGWLGVGIQPVSDELARAMKLPTTSGALISDVEPGGPAARAGIRRDDLVVKIDNNAVDNPGRLRNLVASLGSGRQVKLDFYRNGRLQSTNVTLGELPANLEAGLGAGETEQAEGLSLLPLNSESRKKFDIPARFLHGVVVAGVDEEGVAGRAGIRTGDVILELNRVKITSVAQFRQLYQRNNGQLLLLIYSRGSTAYLLIQK